jgi:hypothetical protein
MTRNQINQAVFDATAPEAAAKAEQPINRIAVAMVGEKFDAITAEFDKHLHAAGTKPSANTVREHAGSIAWITDGSTNE